MLSLDEIIQQGKRIAAENKAALDKYEENKAKFFHWLRYESVIGKIIYPYDYRSEQDSLINNLTETLRVHDEVLKCLTSKRVLVDKLDNKIKKYLFRFLYVMNRRCDYNIVDIQFEKNGITYPIITRKRIKCWYQKLYPECISYIEEDERIKENLEREYEKLHNKSDSRPKTRRIDLVKENNEDCWARKTSGVMVVDSDRED